MTKSIFSFTHAGDFYEITLRGHILARITCYFSGAAGKQDVQFEDVPSAAQTIIISKIDEALKDLQDN